MEAVKPPPTEVVFDVDDFCDEWNCLSELVQLKQTYPNFKCTLFTIPTCTSLALFNLAKQYDWIELALHGVNHDPLNEMITLPVQLIRNYYSRLLKDYSFFVKGMRSPGWHISKELIDIANDLGLWMAIHNYDYKHRNMIKHGFYICGHRYPYWHAHTHDVCDNWLATDLLMLRKKWDSKQQFKFVSEVIEHV